MMEGSPGFFYTLFQFLVLLTILVFVHEWGHYIIARIFGVKVETFSIGFGREIFGWNDSKGTRWKVSWVPLGGYVKFFGDATAISNPEKALAKIPKKDHAKCFHFKPIWQRMLIVAAGPVINLVFAVFIYTGLYATLGQTVTEPLITAVEENSPAAEAGLLPGDRILEIEGESIESFQEIIPIVSSQPGRPLDFIVLRNGSEIHLVATPAREEVTDPIGDKIPAGRLGITSSETTRQDHNLFSAFAAGTKRTGEMISLMVHGLGRILTGDFNKEELGGPVKIAQYTGQIATQGLIPFISFMALISINLGIINLIPIPLLDGGHLLFYSIEAVKGSPLSAKTQELAAMLGLAFVLGLLFVVTWNDLKLPGLG